MALYAAPGDDESLPRPSLVEGDLDFKPIPYRGVGNRAVYDVVRAYLAGAQVPIEKESTEDDALLRLRSGWMKIEKGRRLRFRVRVDGQVALEVDREACDSRGCAETWDVSGGELKLATDVYAVLRGPVEKGTF